VVGTLQRAGVLLGLVTGSSAPTVSIFLEACPTHFDVVISGDSVKVGKPSPDPYLAAATALGLEPDRCWVLEDSAQGLESAAAAGTRTVHLTEDGPACDRHHAPTLDCVSTIDAFAKLVSVAVPA
jgi:HAD superfamily hydrolase (TIGR01509 family)